MGKRKSAKRAPPKSKNTIPKHFDCASCGQRSSCKVTMDKKNGNHEVACWRCRLVWHSQARYPYYEVIDVYTEFCDAIHENTLGEDRYNMESRIADPFAGEHKQFALDVRPVAVTASSAHYKNVEVENVDIEKKIDDEDDFLAEAAQQMIADGTLKNERPSHSLDYASDNGYFSIKRQKRSLYVPSDDAEEDQRQHHEDPNTQEPTKSDPLIHTTVDELNSTTAMTATAPYTEDSSIRTIDHGDDAGDKTSFELLGSESEARFDPSSEEADAITRSTEDSKTIVTAGRTDRNAITKADAG